MTEHDTPEGLAEKVILRMSGCGRHAAAAFVGQCTDEEISALAACPTGNDFKRICEAVEYRQHPPAWTGEQYAEEIERLEKDLVACVITQDVCDLVVHHLQAAQAEVTPEPVPPPETLSDDQDTE